MFWEFRNQTLPNKFTITMGELIKKAREEKGLSQAELAEQVYRRRASISEIENGKMMPDIETLFLMSLRLIKPLTYFIHEQYRKQLPREDNLTLEEQEILMQFRRIGKDSQRHLAINQIKAMADFEETNQ